MKARTGRLLTPRAAQVQRQAVEEVTPDTMTNLTGKTVGFINYLWPKYEPFVDEVPKALKERFKIKAAPRIDYHQMPRWDRDDEKVDEWVQQLDAAVVGLGN